MARTAEVVRGTVVFRCVHDDPANLRDVRLRRCTANDHWSGHHLWIPPETFSRCKYALCVSSTCADGSSKWSENFGKRPHHMSCRYGRLNEPFRCVRRSRDSQYFSMGRTTPKLSIPVGNLDPHLTHGSLGPHDSAPKTASRSVQLCLHSTSP